MIVEISRVSAQEKWIVPSDSLNTRRTALISASTACFWAGSMTALYQVWYKKEDQSAFHTFNDGYNWLQMDKAGHFYTTYSISRLSSGMYHWAGVSNTSSALIGTAVGLGYQTTLEMFDGFSSGWGFSWFDMAANFSGAAWFLSQELLLKEQVFLPKFSFHPTEYAALRPQVLGSGFGEELLKDYNGQTYWISFNPVMLFGSTVIPEWLCLSVGYSADAKLVGDKESYTSPSGTSYNSRREWIISLDLDLSRLPVKKPWLKALLKQVNHLKIPFPALIYSSDNRFRGSFLYF